MVAFDRSGIMNILFRFVLLLLMLSFSSSVFSKVLNSPLIGKRLMVYTKNGEGFVHDNLKASADAIVKLGKEIGFEVDVYTENGAHVFTDANLSRYQVLVFANTNNEVFDTNEQRLSFRRYVQAGGGVVGIHSVLGTERNWPWFNQLIGGTFVWHPKKQDLHLIKIKKDESTAGIPTLWKLEDECYFSKTYYPGIEVLMVADLDSVEVADNGNAR